MGPMTESIPALITLDPLVDGAIRSTALIAAAAIVVLALRRASASMRHLAWTLALLGCVAMPLATRVLPGWSLPALPAWERAAETSPKLYTATPPASVVSPAPALREPAPGPARPVAPPSGPVPAWRPNTQDVLRIMPIAWLAGVVLLIARHLVAWASLARIARRAAPVTDHAWQVALARHGVTLGLRSLPAIRVSPGIGVPLVCGLWRPTILLPSEALEWAGERRDAVLLHELAHVRRYDLLTTRVTQLAATLYWFSPFVWLAARCQRAEAERACDDQVLDAGGRASAYASDLLEIALAVGGRLDAAALAMARRSQLEGRLLAILDPRQPRGRAGRIGIFLSVLVAAGSIGVLAAARPVQSRPAREAVAAAPSEPIVAAAPAAKADPGVLSPPVSAASPTIVASGGLLASGLPDKSGKPRAKGSSHWSIVDNGFGEVRSGSWNHRDRRGSFKSKGTIRYNRDLNDIESISPGGYVEIEERRDRALHRATFRPRSGGIERSYEIDGDERPWDDAARAWLAEFLIGLDHSSGALVEIRFPRLMGEGGPARVLREISSMTSDYGRGIYFKTLFSSNLDAPTFRQALSQTGREIDSDYELAETLIAAARKHALDDAGTRAAYLEAVGTLQSDYEHGRTLKVLVARRDLSPALADGAIASASKMESDYEQAQLMIALAEEGHVKPALQGNFIRATYDLDSDYERGRVLKALIEHGPLAAEQIREMLLASAKFQSDYERANVLVQLAETVRLDASGRAAFIESTKTFSSDHERERTLAALGRHSAR